MSFLCRECDSQGAARVFCCCVIGATDCTSKMGPKQAITLLNWEILQSVPLPTAYP